jgi:hypothetical protein
MRAKKITREVIVPCNMNDLGASVIVNTHIDNSKPNDRSTAVKGQINGRLYRAMATYQKPSLQDRSVKDFSVGNSTSFLDKETWTNVALHEGLRSM